MVRAFVLLKFCSIIFATLASSRQIDTAFSLLPEMLLRQMNAFISMAWLGRTVEAIPLVAGSRTSAASAETSTRISKIQTAKHSQEPAKAATGLSTSLIRYEMHDQERTDEVTIFYLCPYAGHAHRTFRVRTQYTLATNEVSFHDELENTAEFRYTWQSQVQGDPLEIEFETWLIARQCVRHNPHVKCTYKYKAFIEGAVAPGILESAVVYGHEHDSLRPLVTEKCRLRTHGTPEMCPVDTDSRSCTIIGVNSMHVH